MSIIGILVVLIVIGLLLWAVETLIPMDAWIKKVIRVVAIVFICLWLLQAFGLLGSLGTGPVIRVN